MSLEQAIKENTEAVKALTSVMQSRSGTDPQQRAVAASKSSKPAAKAKAPAKKAAAKAKAKAPAKKAAAKKSGITRQQVSDMVLDIANTYGREYAKAVLAALEVKTVKDLDEEQFPEAVKLLKAKLAECKAEAEADDDEDFEDDDLEDDEEDFEDDDLEDEEDFDED